MKPGAAFVVSAARGLVISSALILLLPVLIGPNLLRLAMPVTELLTAVSSLIMMRKYMGALPAA